METVNLIPRKIPGPQTLQLLYVILASAYFDCFKMGSEWPPTAFRMCLCSLWPSGAGPAERTGPGIFLPAWLHGSVLQGNQNAVGAFSSLSQRVCKLHRSRGSASDVSALGDTDTLLLREERCLKWGWTQALVPAANTLILAPNSWRLLVYTPQWLPVLLLSGQIPVHAIHTHAQQEAEDGA